jgi:hypothetical protein
MMAVAIQTSNLSYDHKFVRSRETGSVPGSNISQAVHAHSEQVHLVPKT